MSREYYEAKSSLPRLRETTGLHDLAVVVVDGLAVALLPSRAVLELVDLEDLAEEWGRASAYNLFRKIDLRLIEEDLADAAIAQWEASTGQRWEVADAA